MSNLLKKVEHTNNTVTASTMTREEEARLKAAERDAKLKEERAAAANKKKEEPKEKVGELSLVIRLASFWLEPVTSCYPSPSVVDAIPKKKDERRIHWADNSGKALAVSQEEETADATKKAEPTKRKSRWAERKKKDIEHEKELLLKSR